jgi:hypothetical protein
MPTKLGYKPAVTLKQVKASELYKHNLPQAQAVGISKHAFAQMLQEGLTNQAELLAGEPLYMGASLAQAYHWIETGNLHLLSCIHMKEISGCLAKTYILHGVAYPLSQFLRKKHGTK